MASTKTDVIKPTFASAIKWILLISGIIGLIASFAITYEKVELLMNPNYHPACSLNPIISCGSVMESKQSHLFGFPNSFIGMMAFPVLITTGILLFAGVTFKRWYWLSLNAVALLAVFFVHWLFFQSVYRIHALCPYCMAVWIVTITTFWYTTMYNLRNGYLRAKGFLRPVANFALRHHLDILVLWLLTIAFFVLKHFWYYYGHYFMR